MRILFVSSTVVGGSGRSQRDLLRALARGDHQVSVLADMTSGHRVVRWAYEQLSDASTRWGHRPGARVLRRAVSVPGRRTELRTIDEVDHHISPVPHNALPRLLDELEPDVVVGNSLLRHSWRRVRAMCAERGLPSVLYVREVASLDHLIPGELPDAVVANSHSLVADIELRGVPCTFIPSLIDLSLTRTTSTRRVALCINPIASHGRDTVIELARRLPEIDFVLQESWPLNPAELTALRAQIACLPNVELRRAAPPGPDLYADARVLLVPHQIDNRPRVIAEAQANGIPAIGADVYGIVEAIGPGGITIRADDLDRWTTEIRSLWCDGERYVGLTAGATLHASRPEIDPAVVVNQFTSMLYDLLRRPANHHSR